MSFRGGPSPTNGPNRTISSFQGLKRPARLNRNQNQPRHRFPRVTQSFAQPSHLTWRPKKLPLSSLSLSLESRDLPRSLTKRKSFDPNYNKSPPTVLILSRRLRRQPSSAVASSGLSRRKPTSSSSSHSPSPSPNHTAISDPTRIVYREPDLKSPFWQRTWFLVLLLIMGLSSFALAIFLFLTLDSDYTSSPVYAASSEGVEITYGSVIKLMHERTKFRLHSHDVPYGSGSGQQSVTGFPSVDDSNSYWIVRPEPESSAKQGDTIESGTNIRLQHMSTRRWLHSHLHASPISGNLEVSCFGGDGESDTGDYWSLEIEGSGKTWRQDQRIRLRHVDTMGYLHSHDKKYSRIAGGQQEVCGVREKRPDNIWLAAEGVYLPITESK